MRVDASAGFTLAQAVAPGMIARNARASDMIAGQNIAIDGGW